MGSWPPAALHLIASAIEHPAVLDVPDLERYGITGRCCVAAMASSIRPRWRGHSAETGWSRSCGQQRRGHDPAGGRTGPDRPRARRAFHTDAVQSPERFRRVSRRRRSTCYRLRAQIARLKGVGALCVREGRRGRRVAGGGQEHDRGRHGEHGRHRCLGAARKSPAGNGRRGGPARTYPEYMIDSILQSVGNAT